MSYCRFSSENWGCDVYVYEDVSGGWTTHVAGRRRPFGPIPDILGSRFAIAMHRWSGAYWDRDTRQIRHEPQWLERPYLWWCGFMAFWHRSVHMASLKLIPLRPIGLPFDGESFSDPSPQECASRLRWLSQMGYRVPPMVIEALMEEHDSGVGHEG